MLKFHIGAAYKSFQLKYNCVVSGAERGATWAWAGGCGEEAEEAEEARAEAGWGGGGAGADVRDKGQETRLPEEDWRMSPPRTHTRHSFQLISSKVE